MNIYIMMSPRIQGIIYTKQNDWGKESNMGD